MSKTEKSVPNISDEDLYVVCDGLPGPNIDGPVFVELETADGRGVGPSCGAHWSEYQNGLWRLGPFRAVKD